MDFGHFAYLATDIIVAGGAIVIEYALGFKRLWSYRRVIGLMVLFGLLMTIIAEPFALKWRAWTYNPERTLNIFVGGAALETYLFSILIGVAISSATLAWMRYEERGIPIMRTTFQKIRDKFQKNIG